LSYSFSSEVGDQGASFAKVLAYTEEAITSEGVALSFAMVTYYSGGLLSEAEVFD
jgi:hypothetical protein